MQKLLTCCVFLAPLALITGCATTTTADDSGRARLPTGVTLLESDQNECQGLVQVDDEWIAGPSRGDGIVVRQGQNATFEVLDEEIEWRCVGTSDSDSSRLDCPDDTSHVRITRSGAGDGFLFECYGDQRR